MSFRLKELLSGAGGLEYLQGSPDTAVTDIAETAAGVKKGSLFFCVKGVKKDGHDFIPEAVKNGAAAIVAERDVKVRPGTAVAKVKDAKEAMFGAVDRFYAAAKKKVRIIGITGTKGKTTVSYIIEALLKEKFKRECAVIGTIGFKIGKKIYPADNTTPSNIRIHSLIAEAAKKGIRYAVIEASSHALDQGRLRNIRMDAAAMTNITRDHFDYHKTFAKYLAAKLRIVTQNLKERGTLAVNADSKGARAFIKEGRRKKAVILTYSRGGNTSLRLKSYDVSVRGTRFVLDICGREQPFHSHLVGEHNIYNIMAAIAAVRGIAGAKDAAKAIEKFRTVKGRLEKVYDGEFTVLVDFAHTPDSLEKILNTLNRLKKARVITVFGAGGDRDKGKRPMMGRVVSGLSDITIVTSDNPRTENPARIIKEIMAGIKDKTGVTAIAGRRLAIKRAIKMAGKDDIVLLAGKGHEEYQVIGVKKLHFNDAEEALKAIKELK